MPLLRTITVQVHETTTARSQLTLAVKRLDPLYVNALRDIVDDAGDVLVATALHGHLTEECRPLEEGDRLTLYVATGALEEVLDALSELGEELHPAPDESTCCVEVVELQQVFEASCNGEPTVTSLLQEYQGANGLIGALIARWATVPVDEYVGEYDRPVGDLFAISASSSAPYIVMLLLEAPRPVVQAA